MKTIRILTTCLAALFLLNLVSCQPEDPSITFDGSTSFDFKPESGTQSVGVTTNFDMSATASDPWIHVSPASGSKGTNQLTIRVDANNTGKARNGSVTVTCLTLSKSLSISQQANPSIGYEGATTIEIDALGGSQTLSFSANYDWTAKASDAWIKVEPVSGNKGSFTLTVSAEVNNSGKDREGSVIVSCSTASTTIKVVQRANLNQSLSIMHENSSFRVPSFTGSGVIGKVSWGDGAEDTYSSSLVHSYAVSGSHTVTVKLCGGTGFDVASITGITSIDLSDF